MAMIFAMLIWGLSWSNAKIAGQYADPQLLMFWRFTFAAMTMVPTMLFLGIKPIFKQKAIPLLLVAAIFMVLYNYMYFKGTQIGQAGLGGVITTSLNPVITTILVVLLFKHTIQQKEIVGILMGIFGGLILIKIWIDIHFPLRDKEKLFCTCYKILCLYNFFRGTKALQVGPPMVLKGKLHPSFM